MSGKRLVRPIEIQRWMPTVPHALHELKLISSMGRRKRCHEAQINSLAVARESKRARQHGDGTGHSQNANRIPTNSDAIPPSNDESHLPTLSSTLPTEAEVISELRCWSGNDIGPTSASSESDIPLQLGQVSRTCYRVTYEEIEDEEDLIAIRGIRWREPPQLLSAEIPL